MKHIKSQLLLILGLLFVQFTNAEVIINYDGQEYLFQKQKFINDDKPISLPDGFYAFSLKINEPNFDYKNKACPKYLIELKKKKRVSVLYRFDGLTETWTNQQLTGSTVRIDYKKENLTLEADYQSGKQFGRVNRYYKGVMIAKEDSRDFKRFGTCSYFHPNGKIKYRVDCVNDRVTSAYLNEYDPDHNLWATGNLTYGHKTKIWKYHHPNGKTMAKGECKLMQKGGYYSVRTGIWKFYNDKGELLGQVTFEGMYDKEKGVWEKYKTGNPEIKEIIEKTAPEDYGFERKASYNPKGY